MKLLTPEQVRERTINECKSKMDDKTFELYLEWYEKYKKEHSALWPIGKVEFFCRYSMMNREELYDRDYRKVYRRYKEQGSIAYAEAYKVLAFTLYGFGNWSNSDRRRHGLQPLRIKAIKRAKMELRLSEMRKPATIRPLKKVREFIPQPITEEE